MDNKKIIIITGAASGMGLSAVNIFKQNPGYFIYAADRNSSVKNLEGRSISTVEIDLTNKTEVGSFIKRVIEEKGRIDVLINSAGILNVGRTNLYYNEDGKPKHEYKKLWETNYDAPIYLTNLVLPVMRERKTGTVITVTSTKEYVRDPYHEPYADCKASLTKEVLKTGKEEEKNGIKIVALQPGNTKTNIDQGDWVSNSDEKESFQVQSMNDFWRKYFGNNPKNVANTMYKIAEGKINKKRVFTGIDAHLAYWAHFVPFWALIFSFFYQVALKTTKVILVKQEVY